MKKIKRTATSLFLSCVIAFGSLGLFSCGNQEKQSATIDDVTVWTVAATDKIRQDDLETAQASTDKEINLRVIGGEVESAQIMLTTGERPVDGYEIVTSDLTCGNAVIDKSNVTVYHEKYVFVDGVEYYNVAGYYPDCLVPYESVKKLGENVIAANNNQGLFVSFTIPEDQPAGVYTGEIKITVGGKNTTIPVTVTVAAASIGIENHAKSCFSVMWYHGKGELDYSPEMMDTYVKALMKYRLGANYIVYRTDDTDAEIEYYAKKIVEYAKMPETVNFGMPYRSVNITEYDWGGEKGVEKFEKPIAMYDEEVMLKYFLAFYEEGLKENVNPFEKLFLKGFDEPKLNGTTSSVAIGAHIVHKTKLRAIEIMNEKEVENTQLLQEMHESLRKLENIVTTGDTPIGFDAETMDLTFCPYFHVCATESARDTFRNVSEKALWWYGCDFPSAPFPTYHLDNTLLSPRILSWMQADYDIVGNLYWSCDFYGTNFTDERFLEDQYGGSGLRNTAKYGEGLLFYPGAKYGVDGPIPSMRLEAIRDGLEEYEMIYRLKEIYSEKGYDENTIMRDLYDALYSNAQLHSWIDSDVFAASRDMLISVLELAESDAGLIFTDIFSERGENVYEFFVKDGYTPEYDSSFSSKSKVVDGGKIYTVRCGNQKAAFDLTVKVGEKTYGVSFDLSSTGSFTDATYFTADTVKTGNTAISLQIQQVEGTTVNAAETQENIKYAQLNFGAATDKAEQRADISGSVITGISNGVLKVGVEVFYDGEGEIDVSLGYKCSKNKALFTVVNTKIKKGLNTIVYEGMSTLDWSKIGKFESFCLTIGQKGDAARDNLYLVGISVFNK